MDLDGLLFTLPDNTPEKGIFTVDTAALIGGLLGEDNSGNRSLEKTCNLLQIPIQYLHNAGNDAHVCRLISMQADIPLTHPCNNSSRYKQ